MVSAQRHPTVTAAAPIKSCSVAVQPDLTWPSRQEMPVQIPHKSIASIKLQTGLHAIAIRATLGKTITVCSIYLPPTMVFQILKISLLNSLPPSYCLGTLTPTVPYGVAVNWFPRKDDWRSLVKTQPLYTKRWFKYVFTPGYWFLICIPITLFRLLCFPQGEVSILLDKSIILARFRLLLGGCYWPTW